MANSMADDDDDDDECKPVWPSGLWATSQGGETVGIQPFIA